MNLKQRNVLCCVKSSPILSILVLKLIQNDFQAQTPEVYGIPANVHGVVCDHTYYKRAASTPNKNAVAVDRLADSLPISILSESNSFADMDEEYIPKQDALISENKDVQNDEAFMINENKIVVFKDMLDQLFRSL